MNVPCKLKAIIQATVLSALFLAVQDVCAQGTLSDYERALNLRGGILAWADEIDQVLVESDKTLSRYAGPAGEAMFPTSAHIITARKA